LPINAIFYLRGCIQKFPDRVDNEIIIIIIIIIIITTTTTTTTTTTIINTRCKATQRVTAAKLTRLTHKVAIQLHLVVESVPFAVLAPGGQSGNVWIHPRIRYR
jgi:hypothetical protein